MAELLIWPLLLGLLGAVIGSFVATVVIRWPQGRSVASGRSRCDGCDAVLGARDLVPLLSAALARGRCRRCGTAIDPLHWRVEAVALAIGVAAGLAAPGPAALAGAVFGWLLLALAALDVTEFWLPDVLTLTLAVAGLGAGVIGVMPPLADRLIGGAAGFGALWLIAAAYRAARGREGLGGGDPKMFGAIGLWLGWRMLPVVLFLAALAGLAIVAAGAVRGRAARLDDRLPFGALLAVAAYPAWLFLLGSGA
ncbi:A24 family peptidase [Sphingomonas sp. NFR15]|uniref:prepilin peptidase n=1 Tax=Sphingomonas sp. NFR15 TaxID=1566282 RepID=UPI0008888CD0|nr:A24 family peptidase [Sphingomonas sp. NFR15]SDA19686.1 leader peptidase (prepilin peptidase) / N-methyltransferase [Sphingomonas sp. NFR15]